MSAFSEEQEIEVRQLVDDLLSAERLVLTQQVESATMLGVETALQQYQARQGASSPQLMVDVLESLDRRLRRIEAILERRGD
jgi:hypothetical protein